MKTGFQVLKKSFWDAYDHAIRLFILGLFWLATVIPWLVAAVILYAAYPGLHMGILIMIPLLKFNPPSFAFYRYCHCLILERRELPFRDYFRFLKNSWGKSFALLFLYLAAAVLLVQETVFFSQPGLRENPVYKAIVVVNTVLYVFLLLFSVFYLPMEAFRKRRLTELFGQGFHLFFSSMFLSVLVLGTGLLLGFMTIRFGVTGLIFIPVTAVLELNLLYYIYGKHGKMERLPRPERSFMEILRPFGRKDDE